MEKRIAILGIIVEDPSSVAQLNQLLHESSSAIIGRMGIPMANYKLNVISVVLCADLDTISALSGKIGRLPGVSAKVNYASVVIPE